jgi:hypothetical protein
MPDLRRAGEVYDPLRDMSVVLHGARRQGAWGPAMRGSLARLESGLGLSAAMVPGEVEAAVRARVSRMQAWRNVLDLCDLLDRDPQLFDEAMTVFRYEQPGAAARLAALLTGEARPAWQEEASG